MMHDPVLSIPVLETERLILRAPASRDFDTLAAFFADETRAWGFGGALNRDEAWRWMASVLGHWALRGYGFWMIADKETDAALGLCGIWNPEGAPEPEIGWVAFAGAEGRGIAYEAAQTARRHAYEVMGMGALTSNILPGNTRSIALAERMGAHFERTYENRRLGEMLVYRHPGPEAVS